MKDCLLIYGFFVALAAPLFGLAKASPWEGALKPRNKIITSAGH